MQRWLVSLLFVCAPLLAQDEEDVAFSVAGQVVTKAGRACDGATVQLWDALASDRPLARAITDKEGAFELKVTLGAIARREHPFGPVRIEALQPGRARVGGRVAPGARKLRIVLPKPAKWVGVVRDPEGNPLPGAPVRAEQGELRFATTTDENGAYAFRDMGDGRMDLGQPTFMEHATRIFIRAEGHAQRRIAAAAGEPVDLKLVRVPVGKGRVLEHGSSEPMARVRLVALDGSSPVETMTDGDGNFEIEVEGRHARVAAYREGYATTIFHVYPSRGKQDHVLERAVPVSGTVVDEEGNAIAFASVRLDPGFGGPMRARSDEAGAFRFPIGVLDFGRVTATRRGYLPGAATVDATWRADRVRVELPRGRQVKGTVERAGTAAIGAEVVFRGQVPPGVWKDFGRVYTNAKGEFRARTIPPGATHAFAQVNGARSELLVLEDRLDLNLATKLPVRGRFVDDEGGPLSGVHILIAETGVQTAADGRFVVPDVPVGRTTVSVKWPDGFFGDTPPVVPGEPLELLAKRVRGNLTLEVWCNARRSGLTAIVLRSGNMVRRQWLPDVEDDVAFTNLGPGKHVIEIDAVGYIPYRREFDVSATGPAKVNTELERAGTLILTATKGARLVVHTLEGQPSPVVSQRLEDRRSVVPGFGPGRYRLIARAKDEIIVIREVTVGPKDGPRAVDLAGGAASTLTVTVKGDDGLPLEGVSIDLVTPGGFVYPTSKRTDAEGKATISRLILGPLRVVARFGESRADKGIKIEAGSKQSIAIELRYESGLGQRGQSCAERICILVGSSALRIFRTRRRGAPASRLARGTEDTENRARSLAKLASCATNGNSREPSLRFSAPAASSALSALSARGATPGTCLRRALPARGGRPRPA